MTIHLWRRAVDDGQRARVLAIIGSRVRVRFGTTAERLADRVLQLARAGGRAAADHATELSLDDLYLATACADGDEQAWVECDARYFGFIRSFAHRFLPDAAARDLADQVIADLWQSAKIGRYEGRSTLKTWLGTVVAHAAVNARKAAQPGAVFGHEPFLEHVRLYRQKLRRDAWPDEEAERVLAHLVARAITAMPADDKLLLRLYYEQALTLEQMEVVLGSSKATLSRRLRRTRDRLKQAIDALARRAFGVSTAALRARLELDRLELDLSALLGTSDDLQGGMRADVQR